MTGIGFFAPLPLALMIPFMAAQSLAMGEAFGLGFQYGKRRISAMPNDKFNSLTFSQLNKNMNAELKSMIPEMKQSMSNFTMLQSDVIKELLEYVKRLPADIVQGIFGGSEGDINLNMFGGGSSGGNTNSGINMGTNPFAANFLGGAAATLNFMKTIGLLPQHMTYNQWQDRINENLRQTSTQGVGDIYKPKIESGIIKKDISPELQDLEFKISEADLAKIKAGIGVNVTKNVIKAHSIYTFNIPKGRFPSIGRKAGSSQIKELAALWKRVRDAVRQSDDLVRARRSPNIQAFQAKIDKILQLIADLTTRYTF